MHGKPDENFFKNAAEQANLPERMKIDLDTPLEILFIACFVLACIGVFISGGITAESYFDGAGNSYALAVFGAFIVLAVLMRKCWSETDNYYILDTHARKLFYHYRFFSDKKITPAADFDDIECVAVGGIRKVNKGNESWSYYIYAVDKKGVSTYLSNMFTEALIEENNNKIRGMAAIIGCRHLDGEPKKILSISTGGTTKNASGSGITVELAPHESAAVSPLLLKAAQANTKKIILIVMAINFIITVTVIVIIVSGMR